ncbi:PilZ domain-containing protein [Marinobacter fonticola]|uniref:PilZ domain-containing protein n=1 Tax=Marinobacter fonticola TaxID=2603215 RepID=UPI0011E7B0F2|nr:PilZ domain-containing protein [Marinobacter fonticola]
MVPNPTEDRRDYFRIHDRIGLEFQPIDDSKAGFPGDPFDDHELAPLHDELRRIDQDVRNQLASLAERDRLLANLMKSFNTKVDTLARIMAFEQNPLQPNQWYEATVSEGGIAFPSDDDKLCVGSHLALRLTLPPELFRPQGTAEIVSISEGADNRRWLHTEFRALDDADRQQIARHIMRWQIRQRQRESGDNSVTDTR